MSRMPAKLPAGFMPVGENITTANPQSNSGLPEGFNLVGEELQNNSHPVATDFLQNVAKGMGILGQKPISNYLPGMAAGMGTGFENIYNNISSLANRAGLNFPAWKTNLYHAFGVPQSDQQGLGNFLNKTTQYAPLMFTPEFAPEANLASKILSPIGRTAVNAMGGALLSKNPIQGMETFGGAQGAIESASPLLKLAMSPLHAFGELINPVKASNNFMNKLSTKYSETKNAIKQAYDHMQPYSDQLLFDPLPENEINTSVVNQYPYSLRTPIKSFLVNPTLKAGHSLQSDMFKEAQDIKKSAVLSSDRDLSNMIMDSRSPLLDSIKNKLNELDPVAAQNYQLGSDLTREVLPTLTPTKLMTQIAKGSVKKLQPSKIVSDYHSAVAKDLIDDENPNDFISQNIAPLIKKEQMGHFWQEAIPTAIGAFSGALHGEPMLGGVAGGYFGKSTEPYMVKNMLQNEALHNTLQKGGLRMRNALKFMLPALGGNILSNTSQSGNK